MVAAACRSAGPVFPFANSLDLSLVALVRLTRLLFDLLVRSQSQSRTLCRIGDTDGTTAQRHVSPLSKTLWRLRV